MLEEGKVAELEAQLAPYQEAYRNGAIGESEASAGIRALGSNEPELRATYDRWVKDFPASYAARVARAHYLVRQGYLARGGAYAAKTSKAQFDAMRVQFKTAQDDLEMALRLDAKPALVYSSLISIAQGAGDAAAAERALQQAIALDPRVVSARAGYLLVLRPEWGGSLEQMEAAVAAWRPALGEEQSKWFLRTVEDAKWRVTLEPAAALVDKKQYREAIALYDQALAQTPTPRAYSMRGFSYAELGQYDKALEDFNRALEIDPESGCCSGTRSSRGQALLKLGQIDKAVSDLVMAADNDDAWAARELS